MKQRRIDVRVIRLTCLASAWALINLSSTVTADSPATSCVDEVCDCEGYATASASLSPWFGSADLLFLNLEESGSSLIADGLGDDFGTSLVEPDSSVGFDVALGRYFVDGRYGIDVSYFRWDADDASTTRSGAVGSVSPGRLAYDDAFVDLGNGPLNLENLIENYATDVTASRDLEFQGIEASLHTFGILGARRLPSLACHRGRTLGFASAAGDFDSPRSSRLRVDFSQGFRWFQVQDDMQFGYTTAADPAPLGAGFAAYAGTGLPAAQISDQLQIENNLYGYQMGGRFTLVLTPRLHANLGGKVGLYANHIEMRHQLASDQGTATLPASGNALVEAETSDTELATLSEFDLGLGLRLNPAWTVRGGYRVISLAGVANAADSFPEAYRSASDIGDIRADDRYLLHGAYVGLDYNW